MNRNQKMRIGIVLLSAAALFWLTSPIPSSAGAQAETAERRLSAFVSILPQAYFVERIGGERVRVEAMVSPGQSPHTFEPTPKQIARLAEAEVYFRIGVEFENSLMPRIKSTMKELEVVDCREGIRLRKMEAHEEAEEHLHEQEGTDPHFWLSVRNAGRMAETIRDALVRLDPKGKETYELGCRALLEDLQSLDRRLAEILAPVKGKPLFVFHPAFGYFAEDYGLEQVAVQTGGTEPSARQLAHLIAEARQEGVRVIFVQPQFSQASAETIAAEIGGAVAPIDPLAWDYLENLEQMARVVEEGLR